MKLDTVKKAYINQSRIRNKKKTVNSTNNSDNKNNKKKNIEKLKKS